MQRNIRIFFSKTGRAKYISHLDMTRCWTRIFNRAGLPMWYTMGFNPHLYMTFALPLSLGFESVCESLDTRLVEDVPLEEVKERLNQVLPEGLRVYHVADQKMDPKEIAWADYDVFLECSQPDEVLTELEAYLNQESILVQKRTKEGMKDTELHGLYQLLESAAEEEGVRLKLRMASGNVVNINPTLLLDNAPVGDRVLQSSFCRTAVLTKGLEPFA